MLLLTVLGLVDLKIAIWHLLPTGGAKRALYDQVRGLVARGHHVESWCAPLVDQSFLPLGDIIEEHFVPLEVIGRTSWEKRLQMPAKVGPQIAAMEAHCRICADEINAGDFDILYVHPSFVHSAAPIARMVNLPTAFCQADPQRWLYEAMPELPWLAPMPSVHPLFSLARLREFAFQRRNLLNIRRLGREELCNVAAFDRVLVNSFFSRENTLRAFGLDSEVCYLGTDLEFRTDQGKPRERFFVGLGSFASHKNIPMVIEALALLPEPRPHLAWVGNADLDDTIAQVVALAQARGVPFTPYLRTDEATLVDLLNRATAMIYTPRLEPFGLAPIEAAACGLPVIAVAEGGVRETVIHNVTGLLVHNSPHAVADAAQTLLDDPALARRLGQAARINAEKLWSLDALVDRVEQALLRVLAEASAKRAN